MVIGWYAGQVITVHITRCVVTKRHPNGEKVFVPPAELRAPRPAAKEDLLTPMVQNENNLSLKDREIDKGDSDWYSETDSEEQRSEDLCLPVPEDRMQNTTDFEEATIPRADALLAPNNLRADELQDVEEIDLPIADSLEYFDAVGNSLQPLGSQVQPGQPLLNTDLPIESTEDKLLLPKSGFEPNEATMDFVDDERLSFLPSFDSEDLLENPVVDIERQNTENLIRQAEEDRRELEEIKSQRLSLKKRLREVAEASRDGQKYPREKSDDSVSQEQKDYHKRRRCHAVE